jgi:hypothetical protein
MTLARPGEPGPVFLAGRDLGPCPARLGEATMNQEPDDWAAMSGP